MLTTTRCQNLFGYLSETEAGEALKQPDRLFLQGLGVEFRGADGEKTLEEKEEELFEKVHINQANLLRHSRCDAWRPRPRNTPRPKSKNRSEDQRCEAFLLAVILSYSFLVGP